MHSGVKPSSPGEILLFKSSISLDISSSEMGAESRSWSLGLILGRTDTV